MAGAFCDFGSPTEAFMAAVDPSRCNTAMDVAAKATDSFGAALTPVRGPIPPIPTSQSMLPTVDALIRQNRVHRDERSRAIPALMRRGVACEFDFTTLAAMARSPFYQELLRPHGLQWFAGVRVGDGDENWCLGIQRSIAAGPFSQPELDRLAVLSRSLAGAAELDCAFGFRLIEAALDAFEASHSPVAMINRMGEAVRLNRSAERLLEPDLQIVRRRIVSWSRDANHALDRALHDLIWRRSEEACQPPVVLPRPNGRPIVAYASRLAGAAREAFGLAQGFIVFVDLAARPTAIARDLRRVFGLTVAEGRLADGLLNEVSLEAVAASLGITYKTARNRLQAIYQKTDTHGQGQFIALIARLARPQIRCGQGHLPPEWRWQFSRISRVVGALIATAIGRAKPSSGLGHRIVEGS
jgi:DNA-binding CsgD family transcriptional regulator